MLFVYSKHRIQESLLRMFTTKTLSVGLAVLASLVSAQVQVEGQYPPTGFRKAIISTNAIFSLPLQNNYALLQLAKAEELIHPG